MKGSYAEAKTTALESIRLGGDVKGMRRLIFVADSLTATEAGGKAGGPLRSPEALAKCQTPCKRHEARGAHPPGQLKS